MFCYLAAIWSEGMDSVMSGNAQGLFQYKDAVSPV